MGFFKCTCGPPPRPARRESIFEVTAFKVIKFIELIIVCLILILLINAQLTVADMHAAGSICGGFCIVLTGMWAGICMESPLPRSVDVFYCMLGCLLNCACGCYVILQYIDGCPPMLLLRMSMSSLSLALGIIFAIDAGFIIAHKQISS